MELPLPEIEDNTIYFESTTMNADVCLAQGINKFDEVFVLGIHKDGYNYTASNGDARFWIYALERAKQWLINNMEH
jgi:hypothetical protein